MKVEPTTDEVVMEFADPENEGPTPVEEAAVDILSLGYQGALRKIINEARNLTDLINVDDESEEELLNRVLERASKDGKLSSEEYMTAVSILEELISGVSEDRGSDNKNEL